MCPGVRLHELDAKSEDILSNKLIISLLSHIIYHIDEHIHQLPTLTGQHDEVWWRVFQYVLKHVCPQFDGEKNCVMFLVQGNVSWWQCEESKSSGQSLIAVIVLALLILNNLGITPPRFCVRLVQNPVSMVVSLSLGLFFCKGYCGVWFRWPGLRRSSGGKGAEIIVSPGQRVHWESTG